MENIKKALDKTKSHARMNRKSIKSVNPRKTVIIP